MRKLHFWYCFRLVSWRKDIVPPTEQEFPTRPWRQHETATQSEVRYEVHGFISRVSPPGGTARGRLDTNQASPRTMSWICPGQTREDGGHWPFPVWSCQTATAGSAAAMAGLGYGSDGIADSGNFERFRDGAGEGPVRPRSGVYGRLLRRRPGGGGSATPAGSRNQPRQHRRADSASSGRNVKVTLWHLV